MTQPSIVIQDVPSTHAAASRSRSNLAGALCGALAAGAVLLASAALAPHVSGERPVSPVVPSMSRAQPANAETPWSEDTTAHAAQPSEGVTHAAPSAPQTAALESAKKRAPASSMRPASEALRRELVAAIDRADGAETVAFRQLDARGLAAAFSGKALSGMSAALKAHADQGIYRVSQLRQRNVASVLVSADARRAQVRMNEVWESWLYRSDTHTCRAHELAHDADQTVSLSAQPDGWRVTGLTFHAAKRPIAVACR